MNAIRSHVTRLLLTLLLASVAFAFVACTMEPVPPMSSDAEEPDWSYVRYTRQETVEQDIRSSYPGRTSEELAAVAWEEAKVIYDTSDMRAACDDPVYTHRDPEETYSDTIFATLASRYNKPILWAAFVNFAVPHQKEHEDDLLHAFVGCFMPYYEVINPQRIPTGSGGIVDLPSPINEGNANAGRAYYPAEKGHPFLCFPLRTDYSAIGGTNPITVTESLADLVAVDGRIYSNRAKYFAAFDGNVYLWCPVDFGRSIQYWETNLRETAPPDTNQIQLSAASYAYLANFWEDGDLDQGFVDTVDRALGEFTDILGDDIHFYDYLISYSGLREVVPNQDIPLLEYWPICSSSTCASGYSMAMKSHDAGDGDELYSLYEGLPEYQPNHGPYMPVDYANPPNCGQGNTQVLKWGNLSIDYETCSFAFPGDISTSSLYVVADIGRREPVPPRATPIAHPLTPSAMAGDFESICYDPHAQPLATFSRVRSIHYSAAYTPSVMPMVCSGTNMLPSAPGGIHLWMGDAYFIVGMTLVDDAPVYFEGTMEYMWFDPEQGTGT